jgi:hypothetical protein
MPALSVLTDPAYAGGDDEFRKALADYRNGDFEDCLGKCGSAFESVLKVLCQKNHIPHDPDKDAAGPLITKCSQCDEFSARFSGGRSSAINCFSISHGAGCSTQ